MSLSNPNPASTRAGVVLTADAKEKLRQLADWLESQANGPTRHDVRFAMVPGIMASAGITTVSPLGALVQMYAPRKKKDARFLGTGVYVIDWNVVAQDVRKILGISSHEIAWLVRHLYKGARKPEHFARQLRALL